MTTNQTTKAAWPFPTGPARTSSTIISEAIEFYKEAHPDATEEQIKEIKAKIEESVMASADKRNNSHEARKQRRMDVHDKAVKLGNVQFIHNRKTILVPVSGVELVPESDHPSNKSFIATEEMVSEADPKGGSTFAFTYEKQDGKMYLKLAVAVCRPDEFFDPLIGAETALERYEQGIVIWEPVRHEKMGHKKVSNIVDDFLIRMKASKVQ